MFAKQVVNMYLTIYNIYSQRQNCSDAVTQNYKGLNEIASCTKWAQAMKP